jgi:hypothetical protein
VDAYGTNFYEIDLQNRTTENPQAAIEGTAMFCYNLEGIQHFHNPYEDGSLF